MSKAGRARVRASQPSAAPPALWNQPWTAPAILAALGILVYANSFTKPFVFDGVHLIVENPAVRSLRFWDFEISNRPIGFLTFAVNYALGVYEVWGYHAVNLAIHLAAAWVLYALVRDTVARGRLAERYGHASRGLALVH